MSRQSNPLPFVADKKVTMSFSQHFPMSSSRFEPARGRRLVFAVLRVCMALGLSSGALANPSPAKAQNSPQEYLPLNISVRSAVDRPFKGLGKPPAVEHGKVYALVAMDEAKRPVDLVRPVSKVKLAKLLRAELTRRGFREIAPGEEPEIALTVIYGRGWLRNPYLDDVMMNEYSDPPIATVLGGMPTHLMRQKEFRYEEKTQAAQFEKLFIRVTAWKFPQPPPAGAKGGKSKPYELWKTTMITDDPDNRDLNELMEKLLAAGSAFFDREIEKEEIEIRDTLPQGKVILGDLKVMKPGETGTEGKK